jgi:glyoxylase-like metal-dependent hydrolase (beta-lactamase superfamily II)
MLHVWADGQSYTNYRTMSTTHSMHPTQDMLLPPPRRDQTVVTVSAIEGGFITLPDACFVTPSNPEDRRTVPSLAFLLEHTRPSPFRHDASSEKPLRLMFDLGLRSELRRYIPAQQAHLQHREPYSLGPGAAKALQDGGLTPADIDVVVLSHVHYDHHGDPEDFQRSTFIVGPGSLDILQGGLPGSTATHQAFDPDLLPKNRTVEFPPVTHSGTEIKLPDGTSVEWRWAPVGPFPAGLDIFGDGSVYVIDSPGHLPGHIMLLCQTGLGQWRLLGGDAYHDPRLLTGERDIGTWVNDHGETVCIHLNREGAEESIRRVRQLITSTAQSTQEVDIIMAHDTEWYRKNRHRMFPNSL